MKNTDYFRTLFDANAWGMEKIFAAADGLPDDEYGAPNNYSHNNIREILTHALASETIFYHRVSGTPAPDASSPEAVSEANLPSVASLKARWAMTEQAWRAYLETLDDAELDRMASWTRRDGVEQSLPVWQVLTQVHEHGLQHRAEAAEALTSLGRSPGGLDFMVYLEDRAART
jgi:uncharacterized damage-inducible protein DinB